MPHIVHIEGECVTLFNRKDLEDLILQQLGFDAWDAYQAFHPPLPDPVKPKKLEGDEGHYQEEIQENRDMAEEALGIVRVLRRDLVGSSGQTRKIQLNRLEIDHKLQRVQVLLSSIALEGLE